MISWLTQIKIKSALILIISVALLTLSIFMIALNSRMFTAVSEETIENDLLPNQLAKVESRIRHQLSTPLELSKSITQNKFLLDWALAGEPKSEQGKVIDYLSHMQRENNALVVFWVSNVSKNYLNQDGVLKVLEREKDAWFYKFLNSDKPFEIAFDYEGGSNQLTAFINYKVQSQGKDLAVAGLGYKVSKISADILSNKIGEEGFLFVTDYQGNIKIHPKNDLVGNKMQSLDGFSKVSEKLLQQSADYVFDQVTKDGVEYYVASVGIPELNWKVTAMLPKQEPMSKISDTLTISGLLSLLLAVGFILLMSFIAHQITKPIVNIADRLIEMSQHGGDLTHRLGTGKNNEIGMLAQGFNAILGKVNNMIMDIKETEKVMQNSFEQLNAMSNEINQCVHTQQIEADSVATASTEMEQSIQQVSNLANSSSDKTDTTHAEVISTNQKVDETSEVMKNLHSSNQQAQSKIQKLAEQTQTIGSVVDTINSISEQTNLLALNAAIEAARAGEQGRGFAVVADEVRTLAARTQDSTTEIKNVIDELQAQAYETVKAMAENSELADIGLEKIEDAKNVLTQVVGKITEITQMNTQVATATHEQAHVISELSSNVTRIADMATTVAGLSGNSKEVVDNLDEQKTQLASLVAEFKTN